jgi:hypothetical protein
MKLNRLILITILIITFATYIKSSSDQICSYKEKSYPIGTEFLGKTNIEITGDGIPESLEIKAIVEKNNLEENQCYIKIELKIFQEKSVIFSMKWIINFDDMEGLLGTSYKSDIKQYFSQFANITGLHKLGCIKLDPEKIDFEIDIIRDSIKSQELSYDPAFLVQSIRKMKILNGFVFNASWYEDRVLIVYCPKIKRFITIRRGIPIL